MGSVGRRLWRFDDRAGCASDTRVGGGERGQPTAAVGAVRRLGRVDTRVFDLEPSELRISFADPGSDNTN